jgi:hypothetical protein
VLKSVISEFERFQVVGSMPVDDAVLFRQGYLYQRAAAGATPAFTRIRAVRCAVGGAHQASARAVKKAVGLVIHFHRNVGTLVQIGVDTALEPDGKPARRAPAIQDIKGNGLPAVDQVAGITKWNGILWLGHAFCRSRNQALANNQACNSGTECATNRGSSVSNAAGSWAP